MIKNFYEKFFDDNFTDITQIDLETNKLLKIFNDNYNKNVIKNVNPNLNKNTGNINEKINELANSKTNNNISSKIVKGCSKLISDMFYNSEDEDNYYEEKNEDAPQLNDSLNLEKNKNDDQPNLNTSLMQIDDAINIFSDIPGTINYQAKFKSSNADDLKNIDSSLPYLFDLLYENKNIEEPHTKIPEVFTSAEEYKHAWLPFISH